MCVYVCVCVCVCECVCVCIRYVATGSEPFGDMHAEAIPEAAAELKQRPPLLLVSSRFPRTLN